MSAAISTGVVVKTDRRPPSRSLPAFSLNLRHAVSGQPIRATQLKIQASSAMLRTPGSGLKTMCLLRVDAGGDEGRGGPSRVVARESSAGPPPHVDRLRQARCMSTTQIKGQFMGFSCKLHEVDDRAEGNCRRCKFPVGWTPEKKKKPVQPSPWSSSRKNIRFVGDRRFATQSLTRASRRRPRPAEWR